MPDFAVAVACIDGRFHEPLTAWVRQRFAVEHVDLVTAPGVSAALAANDPDVMQHVLDDLRPSLAAHHAAAIVVAAHADCAGDPSPRSGQLAALPLAVSRLRDRLGDARPIVGVYLDIDGTVTPTGRRCDRTSNVRRLTPFEAPGGAGPDPRWRDVVRRVPPRPTGPASGPD